MQNDAQKNILFLAATGLVLVMVNIVVLLGARNGQIAPVDNLVLWGVFAVLNVCSLLWAVSLLGLQPMVVAVSYAVGGFMAFRGVRLMPDVNVAEIATAGATYGAFGALVVGNATTKVRLAFFSKRQVPLVFIIIALLLVDGLLNSRVSNAGWNVIANALVFPFLFSGGVIGLAWMVFVRIRAGQALTQKTTAVPEEAEPIAGIVADDEEAAQLMFSVPESAEVDESMEAVALASDPEPVEEKVPEAAGVEMALPEVDLMEDESSSDNFFPLEIDKDEDTILLEDDPNLMNVAAMVAESAPEPELVMETDPVAGRELPLGQSRDHVDTRNGTHVAPPHGEDSIALSEKSPVLNPDPEEPVEEPREPVSEEEGKVDSNDWLSSHLNLLNKLD